ncbi:MAG TPA: hypothetical protein ENK32_07390, partial [Anaerolineae bacterium]|nr:hypothetical protein [Anaerolineae bacterium]
MPKTSTPTSLPNLIWSKNIEIAITLKNGSLTWSPKANEFLYAVCLPEINQPAVSGIITFKSLITGNTSIVAQDFFCPGPGISVTWTPDGERFLFTGLSPEEANTDTISETADIWLADMDGNNKILLTQEQISTRWSPHFSFWLDDDTFLYSGYGGGGHTSSALVNIETNGRSQLAIIHVCGLSGFSSQYLVGCGGIFTTSYISAMAIPLAEMWTVNFDLNGTTIPAEEYFLNNPTPIYLSRSSKSVTDSFEAFDFNSTFMDWLPETNQMLVLTWDEGLDLTTDAPVTTQLQLWDVPTNSLTLLVPDGVYGKFSPDGRFLAYFTPDGDTFSLNLLDRDTGERLFSRPALLNESEGAYYAPLSFSPDGRYFTFYDTNTDLLIYNLEGRTFLAPLTAVPAPPVWSPDST